MSENIEIQGVVACDRTGWQSDFLTIVKEQGCGVMWKHQLSGFSDVLPSLRKHIERYGSVDFYNIANKLSNYRWRVIDFATKDTYDEKREEWRLRNPGWFEENFEDYANKTQKAKIVFLVDDAIKLDGSAQIGVDKFITYKRTKPGRQNAVCYLKIITEIEKEKQMELDNIANLLNVKKNLVLQGAPGTGKTYITAELALSVIGAEYNESNLMKKYNELRGKGQIEFVTFHQSMDYEDFIEGLKPSVENGNIIYKVEDGIFKKICKEAAADKDNKYVIIIDEINRGNISKIFGELISLIEADKRTGGENERHLTAKLPYSKEPFSVPDNLYIIGTMNTTDRSVGSIDYAIRRRFAFYTLKSDENIVENSYSDGPGKEEAVELYRAVKKYIEEAKTDMDVDDLMVGHSYFMYKKDEDLQQKWDYAILPLLMEYYKDGICSSAPEKDMKTFIDAHQN